MIVARRRLIGGVALIGAGALAPLRLRAAPARVLTSDLAIEENRVWISAMVSNKGPYLFIIDTGGGFSLIRDDFARSLDLKEVGQSHLMGVGGVSDLPFYSGGDVLFGSGIRLPNMLFAGTRAELGKDAVGSFGAGLFTGVDSDLDFVRGQWRAYPDGRPDTVGLTRLKSRFANEPNESQLIYAEATVGDYTGSFVLDTGAPGSATLDGGSTAKSGLWRDDRPYAPIRSHGIGKGSVPSRLVRADRIRIGPFAFEKPIVRLYRPGTSNLRGDGMIGLSLLRQLDLSTQVSSQSIWAAPNHLRRWPETYPLSGLWFEEERGRVEISDVGTGSPAVQAGLKAGDVVVGAPIGELIARIGGRAGTQVPLTIERGGKRIDVTLTLADYL